MVVMYVANGKRRVARKGREVQGNVIVIVLKKKGGAGAVE